MCEYLTDGRAGVDAARVVGGCGHGDQHLSLHWAHDCFDIGPPLSRLCAYGVMNMHSERKHRAVF